MNTKKVLIVIAVVILLSAPVFAQEKPFNGLVPTAVGMLCTGATNLDVAVVAVLPQNVLKTAGGGVEYVCVATDAVVGTAGMMINGFGYGTWTAATNLDVAAVAVVTRPHELLADGTELLLNSAGGILKFVFGPGK